MSPRRRLLRTCGRTGAKRGSGGVEHARVAGPQHPRELGVLESLEHHVVEPLVVVRLALHPVELDLPLVHLERLGLGALQEGLRGCAPSPPPPGGRAAPLARRCPARESGPARAARDLLQAGGEPGMPGKVPLAQRRAVGLLLEVAAP